MNLIDSHWNKIPEVNIIFLRLLPTWHFFIGIVAAGNWGGNVAMGSAGLQNGTLVSGVSRYPKLSPGHV